MIDKNDPRFRKDNQGRWICRLLFTEWNNPKVKETWVEAYYTIQDYDIEGYKSLYKIYMDMEDPTEFEFANACFGSYEQWTTLCSLTIFKPIVERWRKELALKLQARALRMMVEEAESGSRNAFSANKFLVEKGWVPKELGKRGRPSKEEIAKQANISSEEMDKITADYDRLVTSKEIN